MREYGTGARVASLTDVATAASDTRANVLTALSAIGSSAVVVSAKKLGVKQTDFADLETQLSLSAGDISNNVTTYNPAMDMAVRNDEVW